MYRHTKKSPVSATTGGMLCRVIEKLEANGVSIPKTALAAVERFTAAEGHIHTVRTNSNPGNVAALVSAKLAAGEGDISDVLNAASASALTVNTYGSSYSRIFENALHLASKELHASLAEHGDKWITQTLRPHVDKHLATVLAGIPEMLIVDAPHNASQLDFMHQMPDVSKAWASLQDIYDASRLLRTCSVIPSTNKRDDTYEYLGESDVRDYLAPGDLTTFGWATQNGLTPGLYTEAEATK